MKEKKNTLNTLKPQIVIFHDAILRLSISPCSIAANQVSSLWKALWSV